MSTLRNSNLFPRQILAPGLHRPCFWFWINHHERDSIRMLKFNTLFNMKLSSAGNLPCTHFTDSSQSPDEGRSLAKHSLDTITVSFLHVLHWEKKKKGEGCKAYMLAMRNKIISFLCFYTNFFKWTKEILPTRIWRYS